MIKQVFDRKDEKMFNYDYYFRPGKELKMIRNDTGEEFTITITEEDCNQSSRIKRLKDFGVTQIIYAEICNIDDKDTDLKGLLDAGITVKREIVYVNNSNDNAPVNKN